MNGRKKKKKFPLLKSKTTCQEKLFTKFHQERMLRMQPQELVRIERKEGKKKKGRMIEMNNERKTLGRKEGWEVRGEERT